MTGTALLWTKNVKRFIFIACIAAVALFLASKNQVFGRTASSESTDLEENTDSVNSSQIVENSEVDTIESKAHKSNTLLGGEDLAAGLTSINGIFELFLEDSGDLRLVDHSTNAELFSSDTALHWPVTYRAHLTDRGILQVSWTSENTQPHSGLPWISTMLPDCRGLDDPGPSVLELLDSGLLQIRAGTEVLCVLNRARDDPGRLAIVYAGFLRTYLYTCRDHKEKLVDTWSGSGGVDVHVYTYFEQVFHKDVDAPSREAIETSLKECFGANLKSLTITSTADVVESWQDAPSDLLGKCGQKKLDTHLSQWKTTFEAGRQVQEYAIRTGTRYDYIVKTRLDLLLHGEIPALSTLVPMVARGAIVAPRDALDWTWYCMQYDGQLVAGVTDIMGFGQASQMWTYMNLYTGLKSMFVMQTSEALSLSNFSASSTAPAKWSPFATHGHDKIKISDREFCTPEAELAYWLSINNIPIKTHWQFHMGLLRNSIDGPRLGEELGHVKFTCPYPDRTWQCPGG